MVLSSYPAIQLLVHSLTCATCLTVCGQSSQRLLVSILPSIIVWSTAHQSGQGRAGQGRGQQHPDTSTTRSVSSYLPTTALGLGLHSVAVTCAVCCPCCLFCAVVARHHRLSSMLPHSKLEPFRRVPRGLVRRCVIVVHPTCVCRR